MKNSTIFVLVNSGIINTTANTASDSAAYELYKFKKALTDVYNDIIIRRNELLAESGVDMSGETATLNERAKGLIEKLFNDETEIAVKPVSFEDWRAIQKENASSNAFRDRTR